MARSLGKSFTNFTATNYDYVCVVSTLTTALPQFTLSCILCNFMKKIIQEVKGIQAALAIRGFGIRGFDYSRT